MSFSVSIRSCFETVKWAQKWKKIMVSKLTVTGTDFIISQKTPTMCHISEERSFYVDYRNITFEMIFVSSHSSEWSKNTSTMQKKSFSTPKMHFWWSFSLVSCSMIPYLYIFVQKPFIWLLISLQGTIKTIWYGFTNLL